MKWQQVALILFTVLGTTGTLTYVDLFGGLFELSGVQSTFSGDSVCKGLECEAYINVTTSYWRICFDNYKGTRYEDKGILFKKRSRSRTLHVDLDKISNIISTEPEIEVDWLVPARGKGNLRELKGGDCWDRLKNNKIKLVFHSEEPQKIKWGFRIEDKIDIDPILISWDYTYEKVLVTKFIYGNVTTIIPDKYIEENKTTIKGYNYTRKKIIGNKTVYVNGERTGLKVGNTEYGFNANVVDDILIQWSVPIGDRNFEEYGDCREYEKDKGVCTETKII